MGRAEADGLILDIWNQVEKKFEEVTPNEKRLDLCLSLIHIFTP